MQFRDAAKHHVPGVDPATLAAAKAANKSKSARKNEKRKEKKATEQATTGSSGASRSTAGADGAAADMQQLSLNGGGRADSSGAAVPAPPGSTSAAQDPAVVERQIRVLKKKV